MQIYIAPFVPDREQVGRAESGSQRLRTDSHSSSPALVGSQNEFAVCRPALQLPVVRQNFSFDLRSFGILREIWISLNDPDLRILKFT